MHGSRSVRSNTGRKTPNTCSALLVAGTLHGAFGNQPRPAKIAAAAPAPIFAIHAAGRSAVPTEYKGRLIVAVSVRRTAVGRASHALWARRFMRSVCGKSPSLHGACSGIASAEIEIDDLGLRHSLTQSGAADHAGLSGTGCFVAPVDRF